jgi:NAD(P)-dependent dehydrogenase (short-subunit alcohol dehydrogenase family)
MSSSSSVQAKRIQGHSLYASSKAAVESLARQLANS